MKYPLQKTILSFFVSAFMMIAFTSTSQAQDNLTTTWERTNRVGAEQAAPDWFTAGFVRGMDYGIVNGNERLYVADRSNNMIRVIDPNTGSDIALETAFDLTTVSGGTYPLNDIAVSDDGAIFLANLTTNSSDTTTIPAKFYWWTSEGGAPAGSFSFQTTDKLRFGDKIAVVGSLSDNTIEVWMPAANSNPGLIYVATTDDQGVTWNLEVITLSGDNVLVGGNADVAPLAAGRTSDFYIGGNSSAPARYTSAGVFVTGSTLASASKNGMEAFTIGDTDYLAVYAYRPDGATSGSKTGQVFVYDITDPAAPVLNSVSTIMGDEADSFSSIHGNAAVRVNDNGTYSVFGLEGVDGIAAFTNAEPEAAANLLFSQYIEGSSNNKAIEIYNNSESSVSLENYQVAQSVNGGGWEYYHIFADSASIASEDVYVLLNSDVPDSIYSAANADEVLSYPSAVHHNGDDARAIIHIDPATNDTTWLDVFGDPNTDPGDGWDVAGVTAATKDHTLMRKANVTAGNTTVNGSFGTSTDDSEWVVLEKNDFSNLGIATVPDPLAGSYFIPQGDNEQGFASLADAFDMINKAGLSEAVTLYITGDLDESGNVLIIDRTDLTETNNLTIKPAPGTTPTLTIEGGSGGDGLHFIESAWITIDGSNTDGGDTKDLTITSADASFSSMMYIHGSDNVTVKNTVFTYTGGGSGIYGLVTDAMDTGAENILIENNSIGTEAGEFENGVALWGSGETTATVTDVVNNDIYASRRGITTFWNLDNNYTGNRIAIVNPAPDESFYAGIYLVLTMGETNISGNEIVNLAVNRTETAGYAGGIVNNATLGVQNIFNNMIAVPDFKNAGVATGSSVYGFVLNNSAGNSVNNIYHNTILIGSSSETGTHAAFGIRGVASTAQTWNFTNNIFSVNKDAENAYAMYWSADTTGLTADYNNYYVLGSSASTGYFGADTASAVTAATVEDWSTASGQDAHSSASFVEFVSETDLRLAGESIGDHSLAGIPLATVTTDIDGTERSATSPYKGAFEGSTPVPNEELSGLPSGYSLSQNYPNPFNPTSKITFSLPQTSDVTLRVYNIAGQLVSTLVNSKLNAGEHTVQFNAEGLASGMYIYRIQAGSFVQTKKMTLIK